MYSRLIEHFYIITRRLPNICRLRSLFLVKIQTETTIFVTVLRLNILMIQSNIKIRLFSHPILN